jgi:hypothetical protein
MPIRRPMPCPTWYLRYKANGKTAYTRLGNVQDLGLAQARKQAITSRLNTPLPQSTRLKQSRPWAA